MIYKGNLENDPRGMIYEAYRMENISLKEARVIFLDWALEIAKPDMTADLQILLAEYGEGTQDHPMTRVITEGLEKTKSKGRRGGRMGRSNRNKKE